MNLAVIPQALVLTVKFEGDKRKLGIVYYLRLRESELGLDLRGFFNGRIGTAFRVTKNIQLGLGLFTDFSQVDQLATAPLATSCSSCCFRS